MIKRGFAGLIVLLLIPSVFAADILLVNDEQVVASYKTYYMNALNQSGFAFDVWDTASQGSPSLAEIRKYKLVVWFTGDSSAYTLTSVDQTNLETFLDYGGSLFISSKHLGSDIGTTDFYRNYLDVSTSNTITSQSYVYGVASEITGDMALPITGVGGAQNADSTEILSYGTKSAKILTYSNPNFPAAIRVNKSIIYLAFPFEAISSGAVDFMNKSVRFLLSNNYQQRYYRDADGDGYGDSSDWIWASKKPAGYVTDGNDCNDSSFSVRPGALESCNGIDDNCNGEIDEEGAEGCTYYYKDSDGDGYGYPGPRCLCSSDNPYNVTNDGDCNDNNPNVHPGVADICNGIDDDCNASTPDGYAETAPLNTKQAGVCAGSHKACLGGQWLDYYSNIANYSYPETQCDGLDNDCDGLVDEGLKKTWYYDADGDGYGNLAKSVQSCTAPENYTDNYDDCDDTDASIHPGATEICNGKDDDCNPDTPDGSDQHILNDNQKGVCADSYKSCRNGIWINDYSSIPEYQVSETLCDGLDNDCDGQIDENLTTIFYRDADGDGFGNILQPQALCKVQLGYVENYDDCDDTNPDVNPNATEVCNGIDDDCNMNTPDGSGEEPPLNPLQYGVCNQSHMSCANGKWVANYSYLSNYAKDENASLLCDGLDNDCDGLVDENLTETYYYDADGDGYGNPLNYSDFCPNNVPSHYVNLSGDCNDSNASIYPNATEICNFIDDNCNGVVDEGFTHKVYFYDADGDGYGNLTNNATFCEGKEPASYVNNSNDCNDNEKEAWYNRTEIFDGIDNNCNGLIDEGLLKGNSSTINSTLNLNLSINGSTNLSQNLTGIEEVRIFNENTTILEFNFNFSASGLDLSNLTILLQNETDETGFTLIKGLTLKNATKTVYVKRVSGYNKICIKDAEISSLSEISEGCNASDEYLLECPGTNGTYSCNISSDSNYYIVQGLKHSGIKEVGYCGDGILQDNEQCEGSNLNGKSCQDLGYSGGTLQCSNCRFDTSGCYRSSGGGSSSGRSSHHSSGGGILSITNAQSCTPYWNCTKWSSCMPNSKRVRYCHDNCTNETRTETLPCTYDTCTNGIKDGTESDVDCGGGCRKCPDGKICRTDNDCINKCNKTAFRCYTPVPHEIREAKNETGEIQQPAPHKPNLSWVLYLIIPLAVIGFIGGFLLVTRKKPHPEVEHSYSKPKNELDMLIEKTKKLLEQGKFEKARQEYKKIHNEYEKAPVWEKNALKSKILDLNIASLKRR